MGAEDLALGTHQQVDVLDDIKEQLVAPVLDALSPPANLTRYLEGQIIKSDKKGFST